MADGLSARLASVRVPDLGEPWRSTSAERAAISAYGDAVLPTITEAIGRSILAADRVMREAAR
jgi:hypothetical protein